MTFFYYYSFCFLPSKSFCFVLFSSFIELCRQFLKNFVCKRKQRNGTVAGGVCEPKGGFMRMRRNARACLHVDERGRGLLIQENRLVEGAKTWGKLAGMEFRVQAGGLAFDAGKDICHCYRVQEVWDQERGIDWDQNQRVIDVKIVCNSSSQNVVCRLLGISMTFSKEPKGSNYFHSNTKTLFGGKNI